MNKCKFVEIALIDILTPKEKEILKAFVESQEDSKNSEEGMKKAIESLVKK